MLNTEIKQLLQNYHAEEIQDRVKYEELACKLEQEYPRIAGVLWDIAREEGTHATLIKLLIEKF